jgi:hypothetical protein
MGFSSSAVNFSGQPLSYRSKSAMGTDTVRNFCRVCGGLVFGGEVGIDSFTIYAGSLDDPLCFQPTVAIFAASRAPWSLIPPGLTVFDQMPR